MASVLLDVSDTLASKAEELRKIVSKTKRKPPPACIDSDSESESESSAGAKKRSEGKLTWIFICYICTYVRSTTGIIIDSTHKSTGSSEPKLSLKFAVAV